jgi:hypothetical protein
MLLSLSVVRMPSTDYQSLYISRRGGGVNWTHSSWSVEHSDAEIPQAEPTVLADTSEPVVLVVASPWVESYRRYPRVMSLTTCDDGTF